MMKASLLMAGLALGLAGCASLGADDGMTGAAQSARAELRDAAGRNVGTANFTQLDNGVRVRIDSTALPSGTRAAHVHTTGLCQAPDFASAGPHWNPTGRAHGSQNPQGPHHGDLPNLMVGTDGRGSLEFVIPGARLAGGSAPMLDADGAALVVHEGPDDYRTDPSGNSGGRIACGTLTAG